MRVLVACEFSGVIREAFRRRGHYAVSCDLLPSEIPGNHMLGDVRKYLGLGWDLMIAHPPCTRLAVSGARWFKGKEREQAEALDFAEALWRAPIPRIALENPRSILGRRLGKRTQEVHPWQFGHKERKTTWLWLKNLPLLKPTAVVDVPKCGPKEGNSVHWEAPGPNRAKNRSRTFQGIAAAMADQWGSPGHSLVLEPTEPGYSLAGTAA